MKKSKKNTPTLVIIYITILIAAYGISRSIYEIRASRAQAAESKILSKKIQDDRATSNAELQELNVTVRTTRQRNSGTNTLNSTRTGRMGRGMQQNMTGQNTNRTSIGRRGMGQNPANANGNGTTGGFSDFVGQDAFYGSGPGFGGMGFGGPGFGNYGMDGNVDLSQYDDSGAYYDPAAVEDPGAYVEQGNEEIIYDNQNDFGGMLDNGDAGLEENN